MYENIQRHGVEHQKRLYGPNGDAVIDVYVARRGDPRAEVIAAMEAKIREIGPGKVSKHSSHTHHVIDVAPSTIMNRPAFEAALERAEAGDLISKYITPPEDPAYHIEIPR